MNNKKVSSLELSILISYILKSFILINGFNLIISISKLDSVISVILGSIIGLITIYIYLYINDILPKYNIFYKINHIYNKYISIILKTLLIFTTIIYISYLFNRTLLFINYSLLENINIIYIGILLILAIYYLLSKDLNTLIKTSTILFFIYLIYEIISVFFLITYTNSNNLLPILSNDIKETYLGSIEYLILSTYSIFLLLIIPKNTITNKKKYKKYIKLSYIITSIYNIFYILLILSIIDIKLLELLPYPQIFILSKISILNIFDRLENILSFKYLFDVFITISLGLFYIKEGLLSIFKINKSILNILISIILLIISITININLYILLISLIIFMLINCLIIFKKNYSST